MAATFPPPSPPEFRPQLQHVMQSFSIMNALNNCLGPKELSNLSRTSKLCRLRQKFAFLQKEFLLIQRHFQSQERIHQEKIKRALSEENIMDGVLAQDMAISEALQVKGIARWSNVQQKIIEEDVYLHDVDPLYSRSSKKKTYRGYDCCDQSVVALTHVEQNFSRHIKSYEILQELAYEQEDHIHNIDFWESFDSGDETGIIVSPFAVGESLHSYLVKIKTNDLSFTPLAKLDLMWEVANGVRFLHSENLIHGNLKLQNILVTHKGLKVHDFEGMQIQGDAWLSACAKEYLPPEGVILRNEKFLKKESSDMSIEPSFDIWTLGIIFYTIETNTLPRWIPALYIDKFEEVEEILKDQEQIEKELFLKEDHYLLPLLKKMLNTWPDERPTIHGVMRELAQLRAKVFASPRPVTI